MDNKKSFLFSVIITVSDTPQYLKQTIESVFNQTLDFKNNTQIIFIDYEENHESTKLIREYYEKYPENIIILSKYYLSQAYAGNNVYKLPTGEYYTFMEGNDYFSRNTFTNVKNFFNKHQDEVNIVSTAIIMDNKYEKEHELNYKYEENRVINLEEETNNPQINLKSCFIKKSALHNYNYEKKTLFDEETILINQLLLDSPKIGAVTDSKYHIRNKFDIKAFKDKTIQYKRELERINIHKKLIT